MKFIKNIVNVKKNYMTTMASPYASLVFRYNTTKTTIILFSAFIAWTFYKMIINMNQPGYMGIITKLFTILIGILIITKAFQTLTPLKKAMEPYKKDKTKINHIETNAKQDIDAILNQFDSNGKRKTHPGKKELNSNKQKEVVNP